MKKTIILFQLISFALGCRDESAMKVDCNIFQSEEELDVLINVCNANLYDSVTDIEDNLIGDWVLRGIIPGWTAFTSTSECLLLTISSDSLLLRDQNTGEEFSSTYIVRSYDVNGNSVFYLEPNDDELRWSVGMQFFSENIMYGSGLADDTDTYVYEK